MHKNNAYTKFIYFFITLLSLTFFYFISFHLVNMYVDTCINREFLTWDPELRYIITLKMMNLLKEYKIFQLLAVFLDSPHWPSLRNVIESFLFFITGHSPFVDVMLTYIFWLFIPLTILYILYDYKINLVLSSLIFAFSTIALLQAEPIILYSFTAMLEVQGALIFLLVLYFLGRYYQDSFHEKGENWKWKVLITVIILHQSKYPYGYMLVLSVLLFHGIFFFKESKDYALEFIKTRLKSFYKNPFWILILICIASLFLPAKIITGKIPAYLKYLIVLSFSLDVFFYFYKQTTTHTNARIHFLLKCVVFPVLFWMLIQPDRFGSYSGQITHVETQGFNPGQEIKKDMDYFLVFFSEFIMNGFYYFQLGYLFLLASLIAFFLGVYKFFKKKEFTLSFFFASLCLITFSELSLFTSNRLARHTYHLFPAMILIPGLLIYENESRLKKFSYIILILLFGFISYPYILKPMSHLKQTEICYTGYDKNDYVSPKWIESQADKLLTVNAYIYNEMSPLHVNRADVEYLLQKKAYDKRLKLIFDPKKLKYADPDFKQIWIVGEICSSSERFINAKQFWEHENFSTTIPDIITNELGCIQIYTLLKKK